jgi:hypothetical protein
VQNYKRTARKGRSFSQHDSAGRPRLNDLRGTIPQNRKTSGLPEVFHILISISRILYHRSGDDHLSGSALTRTLERHSTLARGTALHSGKDLAVSPSALLRRFTHMGCPSLSIGASLLAPLKLLSTGVTRYPSALINQSECSDFPPLSFDRSNHLIWARVLNHNFYKKKTPADFSSAGLLYSLLKNVTYPGKS